MRKFVCSMINSGLCLSILRWSLGACRWRAKLGLCPTKSRCMAFLRKACFHTSDNNLFGQSDDGITEIGLNSSYKPSGRLSFAIQRLYRRAGDIDRGSASGFDYGLTDLALWEYEAGRIGIRAGRTKIPFGLYNETREVAFTHPTILLPQGIYFERSRSLLTAADGGAFYLEHHGDYGDFNFKFNCAAPLGNNKEIRSTLLGPFAQDKFSSKPAIATQLGYEINGGEYHRLHGTLWLPQADHPNPLQTEPNWNLLGVQTSFRF
jgi:hypothetical protein